MVQCECPNAGDLLSPDGTCGANLICDGVTIPREKPVDPPDDDGPVCPAGETILTDGDGNNLFCGRGGVACPADSTCNVHATDRWAVCCGAPVVDDVCDPNPCPPDDGSFNAAARTFNSSVRICVLYLSISVISSPWLFFFLPHLMHRCGLRARGEKLLCAALPSVCLRRTRYAAYICGSR